MTIRFTLPQFPSFPFSGGPEPWEDPQAGAAERDRDRETERKRERQRERMCRGEWNVLIPPSFPLTSRRRQSKECWARAPLGEAIMITRSTHGCTHCNVSRLFCNWKNLASCSTHSSFFHNSLGKINQLLEMTDLPKRRFQWRWCPLRSLRADQRSTGAAAEHTMGHDDA